MHIGPVALNRNILLSNVSCGGSIEILLALTFARKNFVKIWGGELSQFFESETAICAGCCVPSKFWETIVMVFFEMLEKPFGSDAA